MLSLRTSRSDSTNGIVAENDARIFFVGVLYNYVENVLIDTRKPRATVVEEWLLRR